MGQCALKWKEINQWQSNIQDTTPRVGGQMMTFPWSFQKTPDTPYIIEIIATEKYITGYARKGTETTGAAVDFFKDLMPSADDSLENPAKSVCAKLLTNTVKRDILSV